MKRVKFVPFIAAGLAVLLAACGSGTTPSDGSGSGGAPAGGAQDASTPRHGGFVRLMSISNVNAVDPHKSPNNGAAAEVWGLVTHRLVKLDWVKQVHQPVLAEKWEWNDPKTLTFTLKKGVHFQKESLARGRELEASDVVASLERVRTNQPDFTAKFAWVNVDKFEAPDKYTVKVTFKQTDADFIYYAAVPLPGSIVPKETIGQFGDNLAQVEAWYGSGPFVIEKESYKPDVSVSLKRNPDYDLEQGLPYLDRIEIYSIADPSTRLAALRTGQIDIGPLPNDQVEAFKQKGFTLGSNKDNTIAADHLAFNTEIPPTNDWRVRKAIHLALDRPELLQVVTDGFGCITIIWGCRAGGDLFLSTEDEFKEKPGFRTDKAKDIAEAKALLAEAGFKPGTTLKLRSSPQNIKKYHFEQATAIRGMLERNLGLKIEHSTGPYTPQAVREGGFNLINVASGTGAGLILDLSGWQHLHSTGPLNASLWNDPKTDELIERQSRTIDLTERKKLFHELQRYLMEDRNLPVAGTARTWEWSAAAPHVRGWTPTSYDLSNFTWQFDKVWVSK